MHLQGFDGYGCTATLHDASDAGFTLSGVWGEQDDFAVLVLFDADNQFEHPAARYLPVFDFTGIGLGFTLGGGWGEQDGFAVRVLYDRDNHCGHPAAQFLPDFDFTGIGLGFTLAVD